MTMEAFIPKGILETILTLGKERTQYYFIGTDIGSIGIWSICTKRDLDPNTLPVGLRVLGDVMIIEETANEEMQSEAKSRLNDDCNYILMVYRGSKEATIISNLVEVSRLFQVVDIPTQRPSDFLQYVDYTMLRCSFTFPFTWLYSKLVCNHSMQILEVELEHFQLSIEDPSRTYFEFLTGDIVNLGGIIGNSSHGETNCTLEVVTPSDKAHSTLEYGLIHHIRYLAAMGNVTTTAPLLAEYENHVKQDNFNLSIDAVLCLPSSFILIDMVALLLERITDQIDIAIACIRERTLPIQSIVFRQYSLLGGAVHPVGLYCIDDEPLKESTRADLHEIHCQPRTPLFLPSCSWSTTTSPGRTELVDVHLGITLPRHLSKDTINALVQGHYGYYHYMQHQINDKGWGCAYRSLQTLASWFLLNHYTEIPVPSHQQIQETLVKIGDKEPSIIGSKEWIGSFEVGYVLDERYGVSFRSLQCANAEGMLEHTSELIDHFEKQGTPVMLGGSSLAFTLLGIAHDKKSGETMYLVLDPHYTGADDLVSIQTKISNMEGYKAIPCSWRSVTSFSKTNFYNFCLPQRPSYQ